MKTHTQRTLPGDTEENHEKKPVPFSGIEPGTSSLQISNFFLCYCCGVMRLYAELCL